MGCTMCSAWGLVLGFIACCTVFLERLIPLFGWRKQRMSFTERFGTWAIVTGSTDGIGEALALELAKKKMNILLVSRSAERLAATKEKVSKVADVVVDTFVFDFAATKDYTSLAAKLHSLPGNSDIGLLVNNVGLSYPSALMLEELDEEMLDALIDVNLRSTFRLTRLVLPGMRQRHRGGIICTGSGASQIPSDPLYAGYAGVKAGVERFCTSLQAEVAKDNILVQCHTPLLVCSKMSKIQKPSLTIPTPSAYATSAVRSIETGAPSTWTSPTMSPYPVHAFMLILARCLPLGLWNCFRMSVTSSIRARYLKKIKTQ